MAAETVSCEGGLEGVVGKEIRCTVEGGGETTDTVVKVTEVDGLMMNFRIQPRLIRVTRRGLPRTRRHSRCGLVDDRAHGAFGGGFVAQPDRTGDLVVQLDGHRVRIRRHHVVMCAAGQDLGHHVVERAKHLVAAGFQQCAVKDLVRQ